LITIQGPLPTLVKVRFEKIPKSTTKEEALCNSYTQTAQFYCGIDLHTKKSNVCILDEKGGNQGAPEHEYHPESFLKAIAPFREDVVVAVECMFTWYWLADLCQKEGIPLSSRPCPLHESNPCEARQRTTRSIQRK